MNCERERRGKLFCKPDEGRDHVFCSSLCVSRPAQSLAHLNKYFGAV